MSAKKVDEKESEREEKNVAGSKTDPANVEVSDDRTVLNEKTARFDVEDNAKSLIAKTTIEETSPASDASKSRMDIYFRMIKHQTTTAHCRGRMVRYRMCDVTKIVTEAQEIFKKEPMLVTQRRPCVVVGDIHGQYGDLMRAFQFFAVGKKPGYLQQRYVFLGDYVDRGKQSLECIMLLFILKIKFPHMFILLRGNHEIKFINGVYGFLEELKERFTEDEAMKLYEMFNDCFNYMPIACVIGNDILCMHGGISSFLTSLDEINKIPKPYILSSKTKQNPSLGLDILWSDPMIGLKGFKKNKPRKVGHLFGEDEVVNLLKLLNLKLIIRGHQVMMNGFNFFAGRKLVTVFTASHYVPGKLNKGAVAVIDGQGHIGFKTIVPHFGGVSEMGEKIFPGRFNIDKDEEFKTDEEKRKERGKGKEEEEERADRTLPDDKD